MPRRSPFFGGDGWPAISPTSDSEDVTWQDAVTADLATRAQRLLDLHHFGTTLVRPTVWDAWSANAVVAAGSPALAIGSHPLADSCRQGDNEAMSLDDALHGIRRITAAIDVPVSADMESGYETDRASPTAGTASVSCFRLVESSPPARPLRHHGAVPQTRSIHLRRSQIIWLIAIVAVAVTVGILAGVWWGVGAAAIVLAISEVIDRMQRSRT